MRTLLVIAAVILFFLGAAAHEKDIFLQCALHGRSGDATWFWPIRCAPDPAP